LFFAVAQLVFKEVGFEDGDSGKTPAGDGQAADQLGFHGANRLMMALMGGDEVL
jgi:hypothetical protein